MKKFPPGFCGLCLWLAVVFVCADSELLGAETTASQPITTANVLAVMERVADWQLAHASAHRATDWTQGAGDAGMMALVGISGQSKYREAMRAVGQTNGWKPGPSFYSADDHCIGQTYAELFLLYREN